MEICTTKASLLEKNIRMFEKENIQKKNPNYEHSAAFLWEISCPQQGDPYLLPTGVMEHLRNPFWHHCSELKSLGVPFEIACPLRLRMDDTHAKAICASDLKDHLVSYLAFHPLF